MRMKTYEISESGVGKDGQPEYQTANAHDVHLYFTRYLYTISRRRTKRERCINRRGSHWVVCEHVNLHVST